MPAARDQRMLAVSVVEAGREAAALMLGMMWAQWRQAHQSLSLLLSGAMENLVLVTFPWWTPKHQREKSLRWALTSSLSKSASLLWVSSHSARKDEGKGGEGVHCKDCIAKERSREETPESFKADEACGVVRGEGGQVIDCEASIDVLNGGDNLLDEE